MTRPVTHGKPADALARHWTDRLPAAWKPYAQLSRLDRPIGWQLLLLPCWMGLALVRTQEGFFPEDALYAAAFLLGAIAMRGAGCTYNDILDRDIDGRVARTRLRPIPSGAVSLKRAWGWLLLQCLAGLVALLAFPRFAQIVALCSLPLVALYPLMKRITWWPQAWLGIVFSWGALVGGAAVAYPAFVPGEALALFAGCMMWTIGYDTIYALQDREDDALVGVRSTARLFAARWRAWTTGFYALALFLWGVAAYLAGAPIGVFSGLGVIGAVVVWPMLQRIDDTQPQTALTAFKLNALIGLALVILFAVEPLMRTLWPYLVVRF
jgi:4-hydroxybenzoate polyprenyltransferase